MPQNPGLEPLNWQALVTEAIRRRKAEKLTQREHAALASVSIPTITAFDRGERTLSLAKAFDILRVVGLIEESTSEGARGTFVRDAFNRWRSLTAKLPENSPARFPHGWYSLDYAIEGEALRQPEPHELLKILERTTVRHTGWPMFVVMTREEFQPHETDGLIEAWIKPAEAGVDRFTTDAAHCDFWRAAPSARLFLIRGYQEDSLDTVAPGTIFDTTIPIWRLAEGLLHASRLAKEIQKKTASVDGGLKVQFRAHYSGLRGRILRSLRAGTFDYFGEAVPSKSDEAVLETTLEVTAIDSDLAACVYPLAASLYERFGVARLSADLVRQEIERFLAGRF